MKGIILAGVYFIPWAEIFRKMYENFPRICGRARVDRILWWCTTNWGSTVHCRLFIRCQMSNLSKWLNFLCFCGIFSVLLMVCDNDNVLLCELTDCRVVELRTFRHYDVSPPGRFALSLDVSPSGRFVLETFRTQDVSPPGHFAPSTFSLWTFRPLPGRFAPSLDVSPPTKIADVSPTARVFRPYFWRLMVITTLTKN